MANGSFFTSGNDILRFIINVLVAAGMVAGIIFFPINTKISALETRICKVEVHHEKHCEKSEEELARKITEKDLEKTLKPMRNSIEDLKKAVDSFGIQNAKFKDQLFDLIMELKK